MVRFNSDNSPGVSDALRGNTYSMEKPLQYQHSDEMLRSPHNIALMLPAEDRIQVWIRFAAAASTSCVTLEA
jgi:hypothetical protein